MYQTRYQHLLFDADDTLFDFLLSQEKSFYRIMAEYGIHADEAAYALYRETNHALWTELEQGVIDIDELRARRFANYFKARGISGDGIDCISMDAAFQCLLADNTVRILGAYELLEAASRAYTISIVSNGVAKTQRRKLAASTLLPFISHVFISGEIGVQKPDKAFFDIVFSALGESDTAKYLIIGDSLSSDIRGGQSAGIDTCWFNPHKGAMTLETPPTYTINSLEALHGLLGL